MSIANVSRRSFITASAGIAGVAAVGAIASNAIAEEAPVEIKDDNAGWLGVAPNIPEDEITNEMSCDVLIVGAGNAGMTAAVRAAELGLDFIVAEKGYMPSTARSAIGAINDRLAVDSGYTEDPFRMLKEIVRYSSGKINSDLVLGWANESGEMFNWVADIMDSYGFDPSMTTDRGLEENPTYYCAATEHRFSAREDSEYADLDRHGVFLDYIQQKGYDVSWGLSLVELTQDSDGTVTGAIFQNVEDDTYVRIMANNVILCTGGYADNPEMMEAISPAACETLAAWMLYPGDDGQGIKAAMWAGADKDIEPTPMLFDRGAVAPGTKLGLTKDADGNYSVPMGYITTTQEYNPGTQPFLKVSLNGKRFANEAGPYTDIVWAASQQPGNIWCQIFDANYPDDWEKFHTLGCSALTRLRSASFIDMIDELVEDGIIMKADTIEELAEKLGFTGDAAQNFLDAVDRYNDLYDAGEDLDYGKAAYRLSAIREAPFYGAWLGTTLLTTEDGIKINANCQALNTDREPIPGLYVAGDCSGSFFAHNYIYLFPGIACGHGMYEGWKAINVIAGE